MRTDGRFPFAALGTRGLEDVLQAWDHRAAVVGLDHRIVSANRAYCRLHGSNVVGLPCHRVSHGYEVPCSRVGEVCPLDRCVALSRPQRAVHVHHHRHGQEHEEVRVHPVRDSRDEVVGCLEILRPLRSVPSKSSRDRLIGRSGTFNRALELVERAAPTQTIVLVLGETGTGKELVARALHRGSRRSGRPFVPVDCSGLSEHLFESELYGHEKGAFTGATTRKRGLLEAAEGGTLFLDEVGDIPLALQVKLLRVVETGTYRRVGSPELRSADFRLVCATHRDLADLVDRGAFRGDLFYRLATFPIELPPLRERREDVPLLVEALLERLDDADGFRVHRDALRCLMAYDFPGNVRELLNLLERAVLLADGEEITCEHLPGVCRCSRTRDDRAGCPPFPEVVLPLAEMERRYLGWSLVHHEGDRRSLAHELGISERTLYRKLSGMSVDGRLSEPSPGPKE